jgi:LmbE family N-acetylglucosaminyl deacetylase
MSEIEEAIREKNLLILSPHYDDVPLTFGGYLGMLSEKGLISSKKIRIIQIFSRSNYQARDDEGNKDTSLQRIQYATGIRLLEDLNCLDELVGFGNYRYEIMAEKECVIRQKGWKAGELFEFPQGNMEDFDPEDWEIFERIKNNAADWLSREKTAILLPLGIKEHIDHIILRDAVIAAWKDLKYKSKANIYFGEDQPYCGLAGKDDWEKAKKFLDTLATEEIDYCINEIRKAELVWKHYPTQVEESYRQGILNRADQLKHIHNVPSGMERIYRLIQDE